VREPEATTVIDLVRRLFNLQEKNLQEREKEREREKQKGKESDQKRAAKSAVGDSGAEN
jgi:hypothetical protein